MDVEKTERGFRFVKFKDRSGKECSLQKSSLAFENAIWLGINVPTVEILAKDAPKDISHGQTTGWVTVPLPEKAHFTGRMHLTQEMVIDMLPILEHFAQTGLLPEPE